MLLLGPLNDSFLIYHLKIYYIVEPNFQTDKEKAVMSSEHDYDTSGYHQMPIAKGLMHEFDADVLLHAALICCHQFASQTMCISQSLSFIIHIYLALKRLS